MTTNYHQQKSFKLNCYSSIFYSSYRTSYKDNINIITYSE